VPATPYLVVVEWTPLLFLVSTVVAAAAAAAAAIFARTSRPVTLSKQVLHLEDTVTAFERELIKQDGLLTGGLQSIATTQDAIREDLDAAEKKRRRAAANNSKDKQPELDLSDPVQLMQLARSRGLMP